MTSPEIYTQPKQFVRMWRNEFSRVICDRLISTEVSTEISALYLFLYVCTFCTAKSSHLSADLRVSDPNL